MSWHRSRGTTAGASPSAFWGWIRNGLAAAAAILPPVHRAGFECRLAAGSDDVDLQQGIFSTEDEPTRLVRFLRAAEPLTDVWRTVLTLAERWSTPGDIVHKGVADIW